MKESKLPKRFWLIIAVAMILVSMIGSNLVQSDGGKVKIHKVNLVVADGAELYAQMYIPAKRLRRPIYELCQYALSAGIRLQQSGLR